MPGPTFVEGDRITLRTVEEEDLEFLQRGTNHPEIRRYIDVFDTPRNREQQRETFENVDSDEDATSLLIVPREGSHADEPVGSAQLYPVNLERRWANLGAWLLPDTWGRGYATEACAHLLDHAFAERGLHRVSASVLAPNEDSVALCKRLGFVHEGTSRDLGFVDGEFVDAERYALLAEEWDGAESILDR
jgi:RimJ/RimL family protein N-acetyltransferase